MNHPRKEEVSKRYCYFLGQQKWALNCKHVIWNDAVMERGWGRRTPISLLGQAGDRHTIDLALKNM